MKKISQWKFQHIQKCDYLVTNYIKDNSMLPPPRVWVSASSDRSLPKNACESSLSEFNSFIIIILISEVLKMFQTNTYTSK